MCSVHTWYLRTIRANKREPLVDLWGGTTWTRDLKCREVKTGFCQMKKMQTGSSEIIIGYKSGKTTVIPVWDRMDEGGYGLKSLSCPCQGPNWLVVRNLPTIFKKHLEHFKTIKDQIQNGQNAQKGNVYAIFLSGRKSPVKKLGAILWLSSTNMH